MSPILRFARGSLVMLLLLPAMVLADPPARVGRLAYIENGVDIQVDRDDQGGPASINWPISSGAVLATDRNGRAEVWIGSTAYRLAGGSSAEFATVDDRQVLLQLNAGSLAVSIFDRDQADDVTVQTPEGTIRFLTPGRYRIDVRLDYSELSTQAGQAQIDDRGRITPVGAGQKASLYGGGRVQIMADYDHDAFDNWVADRENATMAAATRRHVSPYMTGYQDLDAYGDWRPAQEYGSVWYPRTVADDWAPYRYGRWAWVAPWGWTWIDQSPWGFAPFHYGRWVLIQNRWGWVPGRQVAARPVYAPALVGWMGNPGWSVSFRSGSAPAVGWFPLAPREIYVPAYRHSSTYIRQINVTHVQDVRRIDRVARSGSPETYAHRDVSRAVTVVPSNLLREGRPITSRDIGQARRGDLGRAPLAIHAPNTDWLAPVARPRAEDRHDPSNLRDRRDGDAPGRRLESAPPAPRMNQEVPQPRRDFRQDRQPVTSMQAPASEPRRDMRELPRIERSGPRDGNAPIFRSQEAPAASAPTPQTTPQPSPNMPVPERGSRRDPRDESRFDRGAPRDGTPPAFRSQEAPAASAPTPQIIPQPSPNMPVPDRGSRRDPRDEPRFDRGAPRDGTPPAFRSQEAPAASAPKPQITPQPSPSMPVPERGSRRDPRDEPRFDRGAPRDGMPPVFRNQEAPPSAPAARAPMPQAAPQPSPAFRQPEPPQPAPAMRMPAPQPAPMPPPERVREVQRPAPPPPPPPQAAPQPLRAPDVQRSAPPSPPPAQEQRNRDPKRGDRGDERGDRGPR